MKDSKLRNFTSGLAKVLEVFSFIGVFAAIAGIVFMIAGKAFIEKEVAAGNMTMDFTASGHTVEVIDEAGHLMVAPAISVMIGAVAVCVLLGLIFRNIHLIFKKSNTDSPFSADNIRMVREIGIYSILIPVANLVITTLTALLIKGNGYKASVSLVEVAFGLVVLCLSQYFAYGAQLEKDVDGLV